MTAEATTLAGRAFAEQALLVDACTVTRGTPTQTFDPATGEYVTSPGVSVYTGPCRVKPRDNTDRVVEAGGQSVSLFPLVVSVPILTAPEGLSDADRADWYRDNTPALDDVVTITDARQDGAMVGLVLRVRQIAFGSHLTARRLDCEQDAG